MPPVEALGVRKMKSESVFEVCIKTSWCMEQRREREAYRQIQSDDQSRGNKNWRVCNCIIGDKLG